MGFSATSTGCSYYPFSGTTLKMLSSDIEGYRHPSPTSQSSSRVLVAVVWRPVGPAPQENASDVVTHE